MASDISDSCVASPGRAATAEPINQAGATAQICCERNPANDVSAHSSLVFEDIGGDASDDEDDIDEHNEATGTANPFDGSAGVHKTEDRGAAASEQPELLETLTSSSLLENTASMTCQASCTQEVRNACCIPAAVHHCRHCTCMLLSPYGTICICMCLPSKSHGKVLQPAIKPQTYLRCKKHSYCPIS